MPFALRRVQVCTSCGQSLLPALGFMSPCPPPLSLLPCLVTHPTTRCTSDSREFKHGTTSAVAKSCPRMHPGEQLEIQFEGRSWNFCIFTQNTTTFRRSGVSPRAPGSQSREGVLLIYCLAQWESSVALSQLGHSQSHDFCENP